MNSLLMLVLAVSPGADPMPVIQSTPTTVAPSPTTMAPSYPSGESSWFSRFRSRPSFFSRLRERFSSSSSMENYPPGAMTSYPGTTTGMPGTLTSGRIVPVPVAPGTYSSTPAYGTTSGTTSYPGSSYPGSSYVPRGAYSSGSVYTGTPANVSTTPPQRMPQ